MGRILDEDEVLAEIDRHKAWIEEHYEEKGIEDGFAEMYLLAHDHIKEAIQVKVPSAQPGIIQCGDCRHWKNDHLCECLSRYGTFETKNNFYCGYAKRWEDG